MIIICKRERFNCRNKQKQKQNKNAFKFCMVKVSQLLIVSYENNTSIVWLHSESYISVCVFVNFFYWTCIIILVIMAGNRPVTRQFLLHNVSVSHLRWTVFHVCTQETTFPSKFIPHTQTCKHNQLFPQSKARHQSDTKLVWSVVNHSSFCLSQAKSDQVIYHIYMS